MKDRTAEHARSALRAVANARSEHALNEYRVELERMPDAVAKLVRGAAVDIAAAARVNPGAARRTVDELVGRLVADGLGQDRPSVAERDQAGVVASRILATGSQGFNSAEDRLAARRMASARETVDGYGDVAWRQT